MQGPCQSAFCLSFLINVSNEVVSFGSITPVPLEREGDVFLYCHHRPFRALFVQADAVFSVKGSE